MTKLREKMIRDMELRGYSHNTQKSYINYVKYFAKYFNKLPNIKYRAILMTIYSVGLRVSEVSNLKIEDIDSKNMQIRARQGKGEKDFFYTS